MRQVRIVALVLAASCILSAGCSSPGPQGQSRASRNSFSNRTGLLRLPYELPKSAAHLSVTLILRASEGFFGYTLTDPRGTPAWEGRANTGQPFTESRTFKAVPGKWVLTLTMQSTSGSYDVAWKSD